MTNKFQLNDLLKIAKRENNTKRSYLYVNPIQGKHVPVSPTLSMQLFSGLTSEIESRYSKERLLIIGFAETATAIGSAIAYQAKNVAFYMNTTRENIDGAEYVFFTESHSHATEQRLVVNGLEEDLEGIDRIVFAEDEVTTGNTIEKIIRILQRKYKEKNLKFGIISILNSMSDERRQELETEGIACDCLYRIPAQYHIEEIEEHTYLPLSTKKAGKIHGQIRLLRKGGYWNCRQATNVTTIRRLTAQFIDSAVTDLEIGQEERILILGTEEFMFPGMFVGAEIEKRWPEKTVRFHATTRSPIAISGDEDYPLHNRIPLTSLYDDGRNVFIYNFERYDKVLIITDANPFSEDGLNSLVGALEQYGNDDITLIQWGDFDNEEQLFNG